MVFFDLMLGLLGFSAGVVLAAVAQILLQEPLHLALVRLVGIAVPLPNRKLGGIWECCYRYPTGQESKYEHQLMRVVQVGPFLVAHSLNAQAHRQRLSGRIKNQSHVSGYWDNTSAGQIWHGTFQFVLHTTGTRMLGSWLGFDAEGAVQHGPWAWELVSRETSAAEQARLLHGWAPNPEVQARCEPVSHHIRSLVDNYIAAWEEQDPSRLSSVFTDDAVYQERAFDRPYRGMSAIREYWQRKVVEQQADIQVRVLWLTGDQESAVAEWEAEFDDLPQNVRKQIREVALLDLRDGKIAALREYWSSKTLRQ
jgi:ketosteroid isomerase-like protein